MVPASINPNAEFYSQDLNALIKGPHLEREELWLNLNAKIRKTSVKKVENYLNRVRPAEIQELVVAVENFSGVGKSRQECMDEVAIILEKYSKLLSKFSSIRSMTESERKYDWKRFFALLESITAWYNTADMQDHLDKIHQLRRGYSISSSLVTAILDRIQAKTLTRTCTIHFSINTVAKLNACIDEFKGPWSKLGLACEPIDYIPISMANAINERLDQIVRIPYNDEIAQRKIIDGIWQLLIASANIHFAFPAMLNGRKIPKVLRDASLSYVHDFMRIVCDYALPGDKLNIKQYLSRQNDYRHWAEWDEIHMGLFGSDLIMAKRFSKLIGEILRLFAMEIDETVEKMISCQDERNLILTISEFREMGARCLHLDHLKTA